MTGECKPFSLRIKRADSGKWEEHEVVHAYHIPDEHKYARGLLRGKGSGKSGGGRSHYGAGGHPTGHPAGHAGWDD